MADEGVIPIQVDPPQRPGNDDDSDYGSDFTVEEVQLVNDILAKVTQEPSPPPVQPVAFPHHDSINGGSTSTRRVLGRGLYKEGRDKLLPQESGSEKAASVTIEIEDNGDNAGADVRKEESPQEKVREVDIAASSRPSPGPDSRSPLERFRSAPRKALSVTDLISPSWCELQYWYSLTKHGRKKRTFAMKQGTAVHKTLEDEVHLTVSVQVESKEDAWGLRLWNLIQGLRTLRETGMTRELEVWGVIEGQVVNGVIDELSDVCPDRELEAEADAKHNGRDTSKDDPPSDQSTLDTFLQSPPRPRPRRKIYLTDVKTRATKSTPKGASFRPTLMQLMLYHRLLSDLAANLVDPTVIFSRYELDQSAPFSDTFLAQVGSLNGEIYYDAPSELAPAAAQALDDGGPGSSFPSASQDSIDVLLAHNSLRDLWTLLTRALRATFPAGAASIGEVLRVEYRSQTDGEVQGIKTFLHDDMLLQEYVEHELRWWRGEREAMGVPVEEAYKCRSCEFAEECEWRIGKVEEARREYRAKRGAV